MFRPSIIAMPLVAALLCLVSVCHAADKVWTGAGATRHISEGANWQGGIAPSNGDRLFFPTVAQQHVENDIAGATFDSLFFSGDGNVYGLYGNPMTLTGTPASPAYVSAQGRSTYFIILDVTFATQNVAIVTDGLPTGTREPGIQFSPQTRITFTGGDIGVSTPVGSIEFVGDISETAPTSFTIDGVDVSFAGNNGFTGLVTSSSHSFSVDSANALGTPSLGTVMTGQSILDLQNSSTSEMIVRESFVLASEFTNPYWGTIVGGGLGPVRVTGNIELQKDQVFMPASFPFTIDGVISGPGHLEVGRGFEQAVVLTNPNNSFTGGVSVTQGTLRAGNSFALGQFNDLAVSAFTTFDLGQTFQSISNFSCAGTMNATVWSGELVVRGSIALSNCVLNTSSPPGYIPQSQEVMTMVSNQTGVTFAAEFVGYPEGTAINVNGVSARATYHAGASGDDFAFVAQIIPASNVVARTPPQSVADGAVANALVALGLDQWNRATPNARITFTAPVGCGSFGGSQSAQAFADAQGIATAPPFTASGVSQVCFVTAQGDAGGSATFEVHSYAPAEVTMATIPTALSTIVNQPFTLAAELRGANGMSLPGLAVTFQVVMRGNAGVGNAGASLPPSAVTGTDSRATVTGIANSKSGNYDIAVRWGTLSKTVPVSQKAQ